MEQKGVAANAVIYKAMIEMNETKKGDGGGRRRRRPSEGGGRLKGGAAEVIHGNDTP